MEEDMKRPKVISRLIIEVLGAPQEHVESTIKTYMDKLKEEKEVEVKDMVLSEVKEIDKLFSIFADVEIETKGVEPLSHICFEYMPSSLEIIEPEELIYKSQEISGFLNDIQARLHNVDQVLKSLSAENRVIKKNGLTITKNAIILSLKNGDKTIEELSKEVGIPVEHMEKFVGPLVKEERIIKEKDHYKVMK